MYETASLEQSEAHYMKNRNILKQLLTVERDSCLIAALLST